MFSIVAFLVGFPPVIYMQQPIASGECGHAHEQCEFYEAKDGYLLALYEKKIVRKIIWVHKTDPTIQRVIYTNPMFLH